MQKWPTLAFLCQPVGSPAVINRPRVPQLLCLGLLGWCGVQTARPSEVRVLSQAGRFPKDSHWSWTCLFKGAQSLSRLLLWMLMSLAWQANILALFWGFSLLFGACHPSSRVIKVPSDPLVIEIQVSELILDISPYWKSCPCYNWKPKARQQNQFPSNSVSFADSMRRAPVVSHTWIGKRLTL